MTGQRRAGVPGTGDSAPGWISRGWFRRSWARRISNDLQIRPAIQLVEGESSLASSVEAWSFARTAAGNLPVLSVRRENRRIFQHVTFFAPVRPLNPKLLRRSINHCEDVYGTPTAKPTCLDKSFLRK